MGRGCEERGRGVGLDKDRGGESGKIRRKIAFVS